jgi:excisionase family DNA binding protein
MCEPVGMHTGTLITTGEACEITGLGRRTLQRRAATGDLPFVRKLPGRNGLLFDRGVVEMYARQLGRGKAA